MKPFARQALDALLPDGAAWNPKRGGYMDKLLAGQARNWEDPIAHAETLASMRDPNKVPGDLIPDLEKDFGMNPRSYLSEAARRNALLGKVYATRSIATFAKLQKKLDLSGFGRGGYGLAAFPNQSPAANPDRLREHAPRAYYLGNETRFSSSIKYEGVGDMITGNYTSVTGYYTGFEGETTEFFTPPAKYWPAIFFIGGQVLERNEDGSIAKIDVVKIPEYRKLELHRLILETKPLGTWAMLFTVYSVY